MTVQFTYNPVMVTGEDSQDTLSIYFVGDQLLLPNDWSDNPAALKPWTLETLSSSPVRELLLGEVNGCACRVVELKTVPDGWMEVGLRDMLLRASEDIFKVINAAAQLRYWLSTQNFCSRCSTKLAFNDQDRALTCPQCGYLSYPKISPCIIAVVKRGRELLLAQSTRYRMDMYSCLAGFIECGESAEEALAREVFEEAHIQVCNIQYQLSQSWPFPHQLMLGYVADYEAGEIQIDPSELRDAQWFDIDDLPNIPPPQTIARGLIDAAIAMVKSEL